MSPEKPLVLGEAAHIYSAALNGPRGQGSLEKEELRAAQNGIWLCRHHHKIIDPEKGSDFPPHVLLSYKHLHESKVARELGQPICPFGWIEELRIVASPVVQTPMNIRLGKATIFLGGNGTGKSTAYQYLLSGSSPEVMANWLQSNITGTHQYTLIYQAPTQHRLDVSVSEGKISYLFDDKEVPFNPLPMGMVKLPQFALRGLQPFVSDIARVFGISTALMKQALRTLSIKLQGRVEAIRVLEDDSIEISTDGVKFISLECLSGGELKMFLLECAIALAQFSAGYHPTVLVLDDGLHGLDQEWRQDYLVKLNASRWGFQTVLIDVGAMKDIAWGGWQYVNFLRRN
jgi:ABC-type Mn2+/Zn2+ transport system ATPase subunit